MAKKRYRTCDISQLHTDSHTQGHFQSHDSLEHSESQGSSHPNQSQGPLQPNQSYDPSQLSQQQTPSQVTTRLQESQAHSQPDDDLDEESTEVEVRIADQLGTRNTRGVTRMADVWNLPAGKRIVLTFNKAFQPVAIEASVFNRFIGTIARKKNLCPINYRDWRKVAIQCKQDCWNIIESKFVIPQDESTRDKIKRNILKSIGDKWRNWKCSLKQKYFDETKTVAQIMAMTPERVNREQYAELVAFWYSDDGKELSKKNKENRERQKDVHTAGSKSYAQHAYDMEKRDGVAPDRGKLYVVLHKRNDGTPINKEADEKIKKIEDLMRQQPNNLKVNSSGSIAWSPDDIYSKVMGKERHGRVRGLGFGPTPNRSGSTSNSCKKSTMVSEEERMRDNEAICELKEKMQAQEDRFQAEVSTLKAQLAFLVRQMATQQAPSNVLQVDQGLQQVQQKSSSASHEMQPRSQGTVWGKHSKRSFKRKKRGSFLPFHSSESQGET